MADSAGSVPKPIPDVDEEAMRPFWQGAREGRLMIQRCGQCGSFQGPTAGLCIECLSESLEWVQASGKGTVHAYGIMHQRYHAGFVDDIPYNVGVVELDEGPRLNTNILGVSNDALRVGMTVTVTFETVAEGVSLPKFRPAED